MLTRAQLLMGDSSQGPVLAGQVQAVKAGSGISIDATGTITVNSQSIVGVMKLGQTVASAAGAYNSYEWPTTAGTAGQQITIQSVGAVTTLAWDDPDQIPWTAKGQLIVGTGLGTQDLLNVGTNGQILIADSSTTTGLAYTGNYVATSGPTSAANLPAGAPALRPVTPPAGAFRYNSTDTSLEFYNGVAWETVASSATNNFVEKTNDTGIALIPAGSTVQRPAASLYTGAFRFNTDLDTLEFSDGTNWIQLVMLNNSAGYNSYVWPSADGAFGAFLQTDAAGALSWSQPAFVGSVAPSPASDGMLWFDCTTGYFKVYQSCVSPVGWTKVAEPGLPITTANMSALPAFTGGSGTSGSPFVVNTTTVNTGESVLVPNAVTIVGLAPNQYVSIVDLNAVTNEGRYHFTNNVADATGTLKFSIVFTDSPASAPGTSYVANIRVGYATGYIQSTINVVAPVPALSLVSPGSISGTTTAGSTLTYTTGSATGGVAPINYTWVWKDSNNVTLQTNGATYVIPGSLIGLQVYVTLTATDAVPTTVSGSTSQTSAITQAPFPNWTTGAPNQIPEIVSGSWADGTRTITAAGCMQISLDGVTFGSGPLNMSNGTTLYMQWEPNGVTCGGAPSGTTITGTITDGTYLNNYSLTLDRNPNPFTFNDLTNQPVSTAQSSNTVTVTGTNCPTYITGTAGTLTTLQVSVGGAAFVTLPTSGTAVQVNPGAVVQIRGTTGAALNTGYVVTVNMGTTSDTWTVTTTANVPTVTTPSILTPTNGATNLNPGLNTPVGLTVTSSAFASSFGAGTDHVSSDWELATDAAFATVVYSVSASTTEKVSLFIPQASLVVSTTYYVRVRYQSGTAGGGVATLSSYSAGSSFTTSATFGMLIGTPLGGGFYAGQIKVFAGQDGGGLPAADTIYNLIVAPAATGVFNDQYKSGAAPGQSDPNPPSENTVYGYPQTTACNDVWHPGFQFAKGLTIGGFTDWYIPSLNELDILYFNLKPTTQANNTTNAGINPNAIPARTSYYTTTDPAQTTADGTNGTANFRSGGVEAFDLTDDYWTATQSVPFASAAGDSAWNMAMTNGYTYNIAKINNRIFRAIRRVVA